MRFNHTLFILSVFAGTHLTANAQHINFSGTSWTVTPTTTSPVKPGPNYWDQNNVWLDAKGNLHLLITKNPATDNWTCAQIVSDSTFGAGIYQFWVEGTIDKLDKNVVLGLYSYPGSDKDGSDKDGSDEIDIEYSRWGSIFKNNLNYTVYSDESQAKSKETTNKNIYLSGTYTTQRYTRHYKEIYFQSLGGFYNDNTNQYFDATLPSHITPGKRNMRVIMNLWLYNGDFPSDGNSAEVIIHAFTFNSDNCQESHEPDYNPSLSSSLFSTPLNLQKTSNTARSVISSGDDQDWYSIPLDGNGTLDLDLTNLPADYDLELYPFNGLAGGAIGESYNSGTNTEHIRYQYTTQASTVLYAKIYPKNNTQYDECNNYLLAASWTPSFSGCTPPNAPVLLTGSPSGCPGTVTTASPTLSWTASGAASFQVSVSQYPYGSSNLINGTPVCVPGTSNNVQLSSLTPGMLYRWNMYAFGGNNCSGCQSALSATNYFHVPPVIRATETRLCDTAEVVLITQRQTPGADGSAHYVWYKDGLVFQEGDNDTAINVLQAGSYALLIQYQGSNYCTGTVSTALSNTIAISNAAPPKPVLVGDNAICVGKTASVSILTPCSCTYVWSDGESGYRISVKPSVTTSYTVTATNGCKVSTESDPFTVSVSQNAAANAGPITGSNNVDFGTEYRYSISPVDGATAYRWYTVPAAINTLTADTAISITWSQNPNGYAALFVAAVNNCGSGQPSEELVYFTGALAAQMVSFNVTPQRPDRAILRWQTVSETGLQEYAVERSGDGLQFHTIADVPAQGIAVNSYRWEDSQPLPGNNYYRLRIISRDGIIQYSAIKQCSFSPALEIFTAPNPLGKSALRMTIVAPAASSAVLSVVSQSGQIVLTESLNLTKGNQEKLINTNRLAQGIYFVNLKTIWGTKTIKIVKL